MLWLLRVLIPLIILSSSPNNYLTSPNNYLTSPNNYLASPNNYLASPNNYLASANNHLASANNHLASPNRLMQWFIAPNTSYLNHFLSIYLPPIGICPLFARRVCLLPYTNTNRWLMDYQIGRFRPKQSRLGCYLCVTCLTRLV